MLVFVLAFIVQQVQNAQRVRTIRLSQTKMLPELTIAKGNDYHIFRHCHEPPTPEPQICLPHWVSHMRCAVDAVQ